MQNSAGATNRAQAILKRQFQSSADAAWRCNRGAREKTGEIQDVHPVGQVVGVDLHGNVPVFLMEQCCSSRGVERKIRPHAPGGKINLVQNSRAKLSQSRIEIDRLVEIYRQAAPVSRARGEPKSLCSLKTNPCTDRISLVLRNRKRARLRRVCRLVAKK